MKTRHVISFRLLNNKMEDFTILLFNRWVVGTRLAPLLLAFSIAFLGLNSFLFMAAPAQAGGYIHFGLGHHSSHHAGHYGYGHSYGYGYSHPYYGLHDYYGYGHHGYGYPGYGYSNYGFHHYNSYATPYSSGENYSSDSTYQSRTYDRGGSHVATGNGWTLLGNNQASAALSDFGRQAQASPSKGDPKVGYALASADLGRLDKGVWAMRRALRIDPNSLHYVTLDERLNSKVEQIIQQYEKKLAYSAIDDDAAFMLASLHYLRRDIQAARSNIDQALLKRYHRTSTKNLKALIEKETKK